MDFAGLITGPVRAIPLYIFSLSLYGVARVPSVLTSGDAKSYPPNRSQQQGARNRQAVSLGGTVLLFDLLL